MRAPAGSRNASRAPTPSTTARARRRRARPIGRGRRRPVQQRRGILARDAGGVCERNADSAATLKVEGSSSHPSCVRGTDAKMFRETTRSRRLYEVVWPRLHAARTCLRRCRQGAPALKGMASSRAPVREGTARPRSLLRHRLSYDELRGASRFTGSSSTRARRGQLVGDHRPLRVKRLAPRR